MTERRFSEAEAAEIFRRAAETQQTARRQLPSGEGMTLTDLQEIGQEVGIPPELVSQAAGALDRRGLPAARRFFGLPIGVGRTVELPRMLTDEEWDHLVVELRETFDARGRVRVEGTLRQWTNGNLQALLEPTTAGARLRLRTLNGNARGLMMAGAGVAGFALIPFIAALFSAGAEGAITGLAPLALTGGVLFTIGAARLPGWARTRASQMEGIATRLSQYIERALPAGAPDE